ncbi:hypothetical protein IEO21_07019 [Rhodonia placenta]|uniref:Uncharacterized protein n=1 Tax=Rhodonia placenta TaxID=104341 RepID=A0A8H7NYT9_9APHY|nr:hypothetical protein IEO21_07019 [Postia placenta]
MVILDEKSILSPPPPYAASEQLDPPPFPHHGTRATLVTLPPYPLLRIVYELFPQGQPEGQRKILYWLNMSLRRVNRALYIACMHVLRSTYLPAYNTLIRAPYTSDPFPAPDPAQASLPSSPVQPLQRETRILDLFIALKVREDVWMDDSELHLEREESFKDLFDLMQPRSRLEDLVRIYGIRDGVVYVRGSQRTQSASSSQGRQGGIRPLAFDTLSVSFSPRRVGLAVSTKERKKTVVEVGRVREDPLETTAKRLVRELRASLAASSRNHMNTAF